MQFVCVCVVGAVCLCEVCALWRVFVFSGVPLCGVFTVQCLFVMSGVPVCGVCTAECVCGVMCLCFSCWVKCSLVIVVRLGAV